MDTLNDIIAGLKWGNLDPIEAHDRVLRLFNVSRRSEQLFCTSKAHNFSLSKIGICLECKSKEPVGAK